eukprot:4219543-Prymnesium_polylepis.1
MSPTLLRSNNNTRTRASINQFGEGGLSWGTHPSRPPGAEGMASQNVPLPLARLRWFEAFAPFGRLLAVPGY